MISGLMLSFFSCATSMAASIIALVCISAISGYVTARRHPLWPIIGLNSCRFDIACLSSSIGIIISLARAFISSSSVGRNSCSGGSSSLIVTGRSPITSYMPLKSSFCMGSSFASAFTLCSTFFETIISRIADILSSLKNMCSVLVRPMPSAPKSTACAASLGVSALVLTLSVLTSSAHCIIIPKSPVNSAAFVPIFSPYTLPVEPSSEM